MSSLSHVAPHVQSMQLAGSKDSEMLCHMQAEDTVVRQVHAEKDVLLAQVRGQMSDMQRQHDHMAAELQRKLTW